ncbi:Protein smg8 [Aphelenchoides avenae]|nr:Protein smg8 [Aphelenchus avenae]
MAEEFLKWLESPAFNFAAYQGTRVAVVGIIGKDTTESSKCDEINSFLQAQVFRGRWEHDSSPIWIETYFSPANRAVFLLLHGVHDAQSQMHLFSSGKYKEKTFFEKLSLLELEYTRLLHVVFILCHMVVFVEQGCRFDAGLLRELKSLNSIRMKSRDAICDELGKLGVSFPRAWQEEGRVAVPRLIFAFHRNPLRADLGAVKRKELTEKMEKSLENQISAVLRHHRIVDPQLPSSLGSLANGVNQLIYLFRQKEAPVDTTREYIEAVFYSKGKLEDVFANVGDEDLVRTKEKRVEQSFASFLKAHIQDALSIGDKKVFDKFPSFAEFVSGARAVYKTLVTDAKSDRDELKYQVSTELVMAQSHADACLQKAIALYKQDLLGDKLKGRDYRSYHMRREHQQLHPGPVARSKPEHEERLDLACNYLKANIAGEHLHDAVDRLTAECNRFWSSGYQRCEAISLTGNMCQYPHHDLPSSVAKEESAATSFKLKSDRMYKKSSKKIPHASGVRYVSTCNCGHSQLLRADPFTLKEANYDFYAQYTFGCCQKCEKFDFPVFEPVTSTSEKTSPLVIEEESETEKEEDRPASKLSSDSTPHRLRRRMPSEGVTSRIRVDDEDDEEQMDYEGRFLDRGDRVLRIDDDEDEEWGAGDGRSRLQADAVGADTAKNESEEEEDQADDNADSESAAAAPEPQTSEISSEEDEAEPEPSGDYLDNYDVHLRVNTSKDIVKPLESLSLKNYDEIAQKYKGQYLDHMPHTHSPPELLPLFPSWSVVCVGPSSLYSHVNGLRDQPNFKPGSEYLLPLDVHLTVISDQWESDMRQIAPTTDRSYRRPRRRLNEDEEAGTNKEKVKLFIGFDYECPRGHRFMVQEPGKPLRHRRALGALTTTAAPLLKSDLPLWMPCTCKREPLVSAQLMRIHVVTPKAPVSVAINPRVQADPNDSGVFHMGQDVSIELTWAKYYVIRLPYVYVGPYGPTHPPNGPQVAGRFLKDFMSVAHTPLT